MNKRRRYKAKARRFWRRKIEEGPIDVGRLLGMSHQAANIAFEASYMAGMKSEPVTIIGGRWG